MSLNLLKQIVKTNHPQKESDIVERAYFTAEKYLKGARRGSMNYLDHPVETALTLARMKLGPDTIAAALIHDLPHRSPYSLEDMERDFGKEISFMISSLDNLRGIEKRYKGTKKYIESAKRMIMAVAEDFRVLLIKFAERLNNLQHLETFSQIQQKRMIEMTEKVYIPLTGILGLWDLRWHMEDICFKYRKPEFYEKIQSKIEKGLYKKRQTIVNEIRKKVLKKAQSYNIHCEIDSRFKHVAGVYRKMQEKKVRFNDVYDVFAVRVVVDKIEDCYLMLGIVHSFWRPVPRRVKDYIAAPKPNGYQSLHTTVFSDDGSPMEFQIRTGEMHDEARYGVAAHWYYKRSYGGEDIPGWIQKVIEARKIYESHGTKVEKINLDVLTDNIFCYTPKGDIIELPRGSTAVDFAYEVHTELGNSTGSVIINDLERPLNSILKNNDVVEIVKKKIKHPLKNWLKFVKTEKAREKITKFYNAVTPRR